MSTDKKDESVTITIGKQPSSPFRPLEIVKTNIPGRRYSITYMVNDGSPGEYVLSLRTLNTSKWKPIRWIELKILRKLLKTQATKP